MQRSWKIGSCQSSFVGLSSMFEITALAGQVYISKVRNEAALQSMTLDGLRAELQSSD